MIEVLKQMVEALEKANRQCSYHNIAPHCAADEAIQAGKQAIAKLESQERNFCQRCGKRLGKRLGGIDSIHTCTPPKLKEKNSA